jgi:hypothetical protein
LQIRGRYGICPYGFGFGQTKGRYGICPYEIGFGFGSIASSSHSLKASLK